MKAIFRFSLLFLFITFYSCDKEAVTEDSIIGNNKSFNAANTADEPSELETRMQWTSFVLGQTVTRHPSAEEFFINALANSSQTNVITLRSLLDKNIANNAFEEAFKLEFLYYASHHACRFGDDPDGSPKPSNKPPPESVENGNSMDYEDLYVYSLLNDPGDLEFELYLPNGYTGNPESNQITTSAYSSGISVENTQGYIHENRCDTYSTNVTPDYRGNLIIIQYKN
ncbi:hypothetical protein [Aquimarina sp. 2201CG5-10]|uniref:hypothetical protein n=1 Tax=Aquimarina callyspongiae TaxID=3098150 RepID=UPI002AB3329C|nr:hypothetical protein [Aquimarina sp. 2201CG5-10]MDY8136713.1 hypothetical protein [Aquimarina sp. 2201CG5-10]